MCRGRLDPEHGEDGRRDVNNMAVRELFSGGESRATCQDKGAWSVIASIVGCRLIASLLVTRPQRSEARSARTCASRFPVHHEIGQMLSLLTGEDIVGTHHLLGCTSPSMWIHELLQAFLQLG